MEKPKNNKYIKGAYTKPKYYKGWFIGDFLPEDNPAKNNRVEICYNELKAGFEEAPHYHRKKNEILLVLAGEVTYTVNGKAIKLKAGDYLYIAPNNEISAKCKKMCKLFAIHSPSIIKAKNPSNKIKY